jgi:hypothetical protein
MINRVQHLDVLEWIWFLNAFGDGFTYKYMFGDKDTFAFAFAMAEKANYYTEVNIPPAGGWHGWLAWAGLAGVGAAVRMAGGLPLLGPSGVRGASIATARLCARCSEVQLSRARPHPAACPACI